MARLSFGLMGQQVNDLLAGIAVKVFDEQSQAFVASTNEADGYPYQVEDNNDGTYYVDGLPLGLYSVYVGSDQVPQDELSFFAFFNEEGISHIKDADDNGARVWHHRIDDATPDAQKLYSSQRVEARLDEKADMNALNDYSPLTHNHDADYAGISHNHDADYAGNNHNHNDQFHVDDFYIDTNGKIRVNLIFNDPSILSTSKTLSQNLERLENAIRNGINNTRQVELSARESHLGTVNLTHLAGEIYYAINATAGMVGIYARVCTKRDVNGIPMEWAIIPLGETNYTESVA